MLTLKLISTWALFSSVTLCCYLIVRRMAATYRDGQAIFEKIRAEEQAGEGDVPLLKQLGLAAILFLPLIEGLEIGHRFGSRERLSELNRLLFKAGLRSALSPKQLLGLILASSLAGGAAATFLGLVFGFGLLGALVLGLPLG